MAADGRGRGLVENKFARLVVEHHDLEDAHPALVARAVAVVAAPAAHELLPRDRLGRERELHQFFFNQKLVVLIHIYNKGVLLF